VPEGRVSGILALLSENLSNEVKFEIDFAVMRGHPLIEHAEEHSTVLIQGMVYAQAPNLTAAFNLKHFSEDDLVFMDQVVENFMYFISSGKMRYICENTTNSRMQKGAWLLEAVIWVPWMSQGSLESASESSVCVLDARLFVESVKLDTQMFDLMCNYANVFADWLSNLTEDQISDLSPSQQTKRMLDQAISKTKDPGSLDDEDD
jgi:hypothetical protein